MRDDHLLDSIRRHYSEKLSQAEFRALMWKWAAITLALLILLTLAIQYGILPGR